MDVSLYVYDLSNGLARQMSMQFLGTHIDAVYHTSIIMGGVEYFFGAGVQMCNAGQSHHGRPMETIPLGETALPEDLILEYLNSLKEIYTPESYDLFMHNCNNFSNDFAMFLVGKGIPDHITSLPKTVLDTPFGQMLRPQLDRSMRSVTQAPVPSPSKSNSQASLPMRNGATNGHVANGRAPSQGIVRNTSNISEVESLVKESPCAVIFFTSRTCPPCKLVYPTYDELAAEAGARCALIKVDISTPGGQPIAAKYSIRATPTFMTFLKGVQQDTWSGANPPQLRGNIRLLISTAFPPHPHEILRLPHFHRQSRSPISYTKVPPLEKLTAKLGYGREGATPAVNFIQERSQDGAAEAPLPDLTAIGAFFRHCLTALPPEMLFASYDLFRLMLVDQRVSSFFGQEQAIIASLLAHVNNVESCPYNLRLVALHAACNLFSSPVARHTMLAESHTMLASTITTLIANSLLDKEHSNLRVAAASLAFNLATTDFLARTASPETDHNSLQYLAESTKIELAAALIEAISNETQSAEAIQGMVVALGRLVYMTPVGGELLDTCAALEAGKAVLDKDRVVAKQDRDRELIREVGGKLLGNP